MAARCCSVGRWLLALVLASGAAREAWAEGAPEIYGVTPNEGAAGDTVRIKGRGFHGTIRVIFAVGKTSKDARFSVESDDELSVTVPDYFLPDVSATLAVLTSKGVTVGMPASAVRVDGKSKNTPKIGFFHVLKEGMLDLVNGVAVIEDGGAARGGSSAALQFVKRGGGLERYQNTSGTIFYERGALLSAVDGTRKSSHEDQVKRIEVREISESLGIDSFLFKAPAQAAGEPTSSPRIRAIAPPRVWVSDVVLLTGAGFLGTSHVFVGNKLTEVGFQVMSDRQLRLVMPDQLGYPGHEAWLMVMNAKGVTITLPARRAALTRTSNSRGLIWPGENGLWSVSGGRSLQFVGARQRVDQEGASRASIVFAKNGAKITPHVPGTLFYEPEADVPRTAIAERRKLYEQRGLGEPHIYEVEKIAVSETALLQIAPPWE
ncbi:MAG TPA: hypothetical protein VF278_07700 [Pirellulales bacterium]